MKTNYLQVCTLQFVLISSMSFLQHANTPGAVCITLLILKLRISITFQLYMYIHEKYEANRIPVQGNILPPLAGIMHLHY